jgi:hypothetical protein
MPLRLPLPSASTSEIKYRRVVLLTVAAAVLSVGIVGCARKELPEMGSSAEQLYAGRCGSCHRPYLPSTMTSAMWATQVDAMQLKMSQAGVLPLSDSERRDILDYLQRNAGSD